MKTIIGKLFFQIVTIGNFTVWVLWDWCLQVRRLRTLQEVNVLNRFRVCLIIYCNCIYNSFIDDLF